MRQILAAFLLLCAINAHALAETPVAPCRLLIAEDSSAWPQKRMRLFVTTPETDVDTLLATGKFVAEDAIRRTGFHYVDVLLIDEDGPKDRAMLDAAMARAWVRHAPDAAKIPFMNVKWMAKIRVGDHQHDGYWTETVEPSLLQIRRATYAEQDHCRLPETIEWAD